MSGLRWEDGVPVSTEFEDPYYSRADGLAETRHVFLDGCGLPKRWSGRDRFCIGELGFGTGLNFCAAWQLWKQTAQGVLDFVSFELHPLKVGELDQALRAWPELDEEREALSSVWLPEGGGFDLDTARLTVITGDARQTLPVWDGRADAWFLDGFAPSRNPSMWEATLLQTVRDKSAPGARAATYSVAGVVRRGLSDAGFKLRKRAGYGAKREMLTAFLE